MDKIKTRNVSDFLNRELKEYAMDILENRCIPSVIDSFKPSQRKVVYVAEKIWKTGNEKPMKVFQLTGRTAMEAYYHHGNQSMDALITNMGQRFKNNIPILEGIGQYGSLRSPHAGAPRYISTKLSPNFRLIYKDFELLENQIDEGVVIEPKWYLCIIPIIIVNSSSAIGMGYASNILGRNPKDVVQACIDHLNGKKIKELKPWFAEFSGSWTRDKENPNKWYAKGIYELGKCNVHVTELPPDWTFEKYESYLDGLVDKKTIKDYDNNSSSVVDYDLKFKKDELQALVDKDKLENLLKITSSFTENLTTLDENGKLKIFDCAEDIVKYFVEFRLGYYQKRKDYLLDKYNKELKELCLRAKFIKSIIDKKLVVNNVKKEIIIGWLEDNHFDKIDGSYNYLLNMPIWSLTKERFDDLMEKAKQKKLQIEETEKLKPKEMYLGDLQELKKKV
jgi:DNA topoisomerase II